MAIQEQLVLKSCKFKLACLLTCFMIDVNVCMLNIATSCIVWHKQHGWQALNTATWCLITKISCGCGGDAQCNFTLTKFTSIRHKVCLLKAIQNSCVCSVNTTAIWWTEMAGSKQQSSRSRMTPVILQSHTCKPQYWRCLACSHWVLWCLPAAPLETGQDTRHSDWMHQILSWASPWLRRCHCWPLFVASCPEGHVSVESSIETQVTRDFPFVHSLLLLVLKGIYLQRQDGKCMSPSVSWLPFRTQSHMLHALVSTADMHIGDVHACNDPQAEWMSTADWSAARSYPQHGNSYSPSELWVALLIQFIQIFDLQPGALSATYGVVNTTLASRWKDPPML